MLKSGVIKLALVVSAFACGTTLANTKSSLQVSGGSAIQAIDGSAIQAIDGSAVQAIDGSAIQAIDGSAIQAIDGSAIQAIDGSAIQAIDGSAIQAIDGSAIQAIDGSAIQAIDGSAIQAIDGSAIQAIDGSGACGTLLFQGPVTSNSNSRTIALGEFVFHQSELSNVLEHQTIAIYGDVVSRAIQPRIIASSPEIYAPGAMQIAVTGNVNAKIDTLATLKVADSLVDYVNLLPVSDRIFVGDMVTVLGIQPLPNGVIQATSICIR